MDASLQFKSPKEVIVDTSSNSEHRWQVRAVGAFVAGIYVSENAHFCRTVFFRQTKYN